MLMSLVANAIKVSPPGAFVRISAAATDSAVEVTVSDEGSGMSAETQAQLFSEGRVDARASTGMEGAGLGLYLLHEIVTAQGGDVRVLSTPGAGSAFTLVLPRAG